MRAQVVGLPREIKFREMVVRAVGAAAELADIGDGTW